VRTKKLQIAVDGFSEKAMPSPMRCFKGAKRPDSKSPGKRG